jgi:hypothetical protein
MESSTSVTRRVLKIVKKITFVDDIVIEVEHDKPEQVYSVYLSWKSSLAHGRVVRRRKSEKHDVPIIDTGIDVIEVGSRAEGDVLLKGGDEVVFQWRAVTPGRPAYSSSAELTIKVDV